MFEIRHNIMDYHKLGFTVVVPTNVGWTQNGKSVMGAGLARQVARDYDWIPMQYGNWCQRYGERIHVMRNDHFIMLPVKPLNEAQPHLSWMADADTDLIQRSINQLADYANSNPDMHIVMPRIGCGNGGLEWRDVRPIVESAGIDHLTIVDLASDIPFIPETLELNDEVFLICWEEGSWWCSEIRTGNHWVGGDPDSYAADSGIDFGDNPWNVQNYYENQCEWFEVYDDEQLWEARYYYLEARRLNKRWDSKVWW